MVARTLKLRDRLRADLRTLSRPMNDPIESNGGAEAGSSPVACSPRLFEVSVLIHRVAVILATSEEDALKHVEDWEDSWDNYSDRIDISDHQVVDTRDLKVSDPRDWKVEAHDITRDARNLLPTDDEEENGMDEGRRTSVSENTLSAL